ncbi:hypothetical protein ACJMK2_026350 [Sinanodonta woodiana]|uniref:Ig-like domain-containing protein n=1 Tax=Sinanodonta woodiana TaxID=1069815 RepID=A0ABD3XL67_SINWO
MNCKFVIDSSMYCEVRNTTNKEWRFVVVLFNVSQASSGYYTGEIKYGKKKPINSTIKLNVIEKPKIMEVKTTILHKPLRVKCIVEGELKNLSYYWKLNGTSLNSTDIMDTSLTYSNLTMEDKWNIFSCLVCSDSNCCMESETYVPDPYYGPDSVSLSLNDSDVYLNANETFKMNCSADCNPPCSFLWKGYVSSQSQELVINNFDSRMTGTYSCITTNTKTGVTVKSKNITLHYEKDSSPTSSTSLGETGDSLLKLLGIGLFSAAVSLVIVGVLLILTNRRKYHSRRFGLHTVIEPCAVSSNRALNEDFNLNVRDRPLPSPANHARTCRMMVGSSNPRINRKSRSCGAFFDDNNDAWSPIRQTLFMHLSHEIGRRVESDESIIKSYCSKMDSRCSINVPENGIMLEEQYSQVRKNKQKSDLQQNLGERLHRLNSFQEDQYSTVDETRLCVYDYARENTQDDDLQTNQGNAESRNNDSDYDYATFQ